MTSWWAEADAQADRATFAARAAVQWDTVMRWTKPLRITGQDVRRPHRKFDQGSTLIVRTRLSDTEAA